METSNSSEKKFHPFLYFLNQVKKLKTTQTQIDEDLIQEYLKKFNLSLNKLPPEKEIENLFEAYIMNDAAKYQRKVWKNQEKILLLWVVYFYLKMNIKKQKELDKNDWNCIAKILNKNVLECVFKFNSLISSRIQLSSWTLEEESLLYSIVRPKQNKKMNIRWVDVAKEFYQKSSSLVFRNEKICRSHWISHLDPTLKKTSWTTEEDYILLNEYSNNKDKWTKISKKLKGRDVYSVKNRFYKLYKKPHLNDEIACKLSSLDKVMIRSYSDSQSSDQNSYKNQLFYPNCILNSSINSNTSLSSFFILSPEDWNNIYKTNSFENQKNEPVNQIPNFEKNINLYESVEKYFAF